MKYYAVTDDPNELMHFGVKGMKWGVIRTPEQLGHHKPARSSRPRSKAYQSAKLKLDRALSKGIQNVQARWDNYNSPANKAARQQKRDVNRAVRQYKKQERQFEKHVQLARQGRLKYKGISDSEVQRITDRLALERNARSLSGAEKQEFVRRLGESMANGVVTGVGQGMANATAERLSRKSKLKTNRLMTEQQNQMHEAQAKRDFKRSQKEQRARDKYADDRADKNVRRDAERELDKEYWKMATEEGYKTGVRGLISNTHVNVDEYGRVMGISTSLPSSATRRKRAQALAAHKKTQEAEKKEEERITRAEQDARDRQKKIQDMRDTMLTTYYYQVARNQANIKYPTSQKPAAQSAQPKQQAVPQNQSVSARPTATVHRATTRHKPKRRTKYTTSKGRT